MSSGDMQDCGLLTSAKLPIPLQGISVDVQVKGFVSDVSATLKYKNLEEKEVDTVFVFPLDEDSAIYSFEATVDGKTIVADLLEKEQAQKTYGGAIKQGQQVFLLEEDKNAGFIFSCNMGNLLPSQEAAVTLRFVQELVVKADGAVHFVLPAVLNPRYTPKEQPNAEGGETKSTSPPELPISPIPYTLSLSAHFQSAYGISKIESNCEITPIQYSNDEKTAAQVSLTEGHKFDRDVELLAYHTDLNKPSVTLEAGIPDAEAGSFMVDPVVMLNFYPSFPEAQEQSNLGEFVFVVDRSGSMEGPINSEPNAPQRIQSAKETLVLLLKSLPLGCYFNIYGFGSQFESFFPESVEHTQQSLNDAIEKVNQIKADLGGTNILEPLNNIYETARRPEHPRQVFIFTYGEVGNTKQVIEEVKRNSQSHRCFTFGIGDGASTALIKGISHVASGTFDFITAEDQIQHKVLKALKCALQPTVKEVSLNWTLPPDVESNLTSQTPTTIYQGQRSIIYAQLKGKLNEDAEGQVSLQYKFKDQTFTSPLQFPLKLQNAERSTIHRLAAKNLISQLETDLESEDVKKRILETSLQSGIISSLSTYVAVYKDSKTQVEGAPVLRQSCVLDCSAPQVAVCHFPAPVAIPCDPIPVPENDGQPTVETTSDNSAPPGEQTEDGATPAPSSEQPEVAGDPAPSSEQPEVAGDPAPSSGQPEAAVDPAPSSEQPEVAGDPAPSSEQPEVAGDPAPSSEQPEVAGDPAPSSEQPEAAGDPAPSSEQPEAAVDPAPSSEQPEAAGDPAPSSEQPEVAGDPAPSSEQPEVAGDPAPSSEQPEAAGDPAPSSEQPEAAVDPAPSSEQPEAAVDPAPSSEQPEAAVDPAPSSEQPEAAVDPAPSSEQPEAAVDPAPSSEQPEAAVDPAPSSEQPEAAVDPAPSSGQPEAAVDAAPSSEQPEAAVDAAPSSEQPEAAVDAAPSSEQPEAAVDAAPSSEQPEAAVDAAPSSEQPEAAVDAAPSSEQPEAAVDAAPSSEQPEAAVDAAPSSEQPEAAVDAAPSSEQPEAAVDAAPSSEQPEAAVDAAPSSEQPEAAVDAAPSSEQPEAAVDAAPSSEQPEAAVDAAPSSEQPEAAVDAAPSSEQPEAAVDPAPSSEQPEAAVDPAPSSEQPEAAVDAAPSSEQPEAAVDAAPSSEQPEAAVDPAPSSEQPEAAVDPAPSSEQPEAAVDPAPSSEQPEAAVDPAPSSEQPEAAVDPAENPPSETVETPPLSRLISLQNVDGSWTPSSEFALILGISEDFKENIPVSDLDPSVWATLLAVIWINSSNLEKSDEWELLETKAITIIKDKAGSSLGDSVTAGNALLKSSVDPKVFGL